MADAFICDAVRTPLGRYGGALSVARPDDLAPIPFTALMQRNPSADWVQVDVILGSANQAGENNRYVNSSATVGVLPSARWCVGVGQKIAVILERV